MSRETPTVAEAQSTRADPPTAAAVPAWDWRVAGDRISKMLLLGAVVILLYPFATMAWAEWAARGVDEQLDAAVAAFSAERDAAAADGGADAPTMAELADRFAEHVQPGQAIGRLVIPAIDVDEVIFEGSEQLSLEGFDESLRLGPSRLAWTSFPGHGSNTLLAGHRTTFTRPFWSLDELDAGDAVMLEMPYGTFEFEVTGQTTVVPIQVDIAQDHGVEELTLSTCTPRYSATRRLTVQTRLVSQEIVE